ncbi:MAG: hypothetical protein IBJ03_00940 [Gemmatimonadaceae bacterium]|nr:hypothetical protein [Gemmatimonadaceae bacterium]
MISAMTSVGHAPAARVVRIHRAHRALLAVVAFAGAIATPTQAEAQRDRRLGGVPRDVALEVTRIFNAPTTRKVRGDFTLAASDTVRGDLAILNGNARLAGVVYGEVVVLNGDAFLSEGARLERSLTVLGGTFESPERPQVLGDIRVWSSRYRYKEEADTLVAETDFFARWSRWVRDDDNSGTESQLFVTTAHTYNRVEGLPILVGPRFRARAGDTRVRAELFGIFRTGDGIEWERENLGHRALLELRQGNRTGVAVGGRLFDEVDAMEKWQLSDTEIGLNSFLFTRDYRDYWQRHGGQGYVALFAGRGSELRASYGEERWISRRARDPWTLFNSDLRWRRNPVADEGVLKLFTLSGTLDTRTNAENPRSGWYLRGEFERGTGVFDTMGELTPGVRFQPAGAQTPLNQGIEYSRAFFDLRRYNRLGPNAQLNFRAVFGGWVDGDALPVQRRLAVSGLDALPGFDFRRMQGTSDIGTCATGDENAYELLGRPAQCERMALVQVEWKGDFRFNLFGDDSDYGDRRWGVGRVRADGTWVVFANTGRGWLIDRPSPISAPQPDLGGLVFGKNEIPGFDTWRTDIGGGFDFGNFGVYIAQAVSQSGLSPNVYVRLSRRF